MKPPTSRPAPAPGLFDRWAPRLILALVFLVPLIFWLDLQDAFDLPKLSLLYAADLILIGLALWQNTSNGRCPIRRTPLDLPLLCFLGVTTLATIFSVEPALSVFGQYRVYVFGLLPLLAFVLLFEFTAGSASPGFVFRLNSTLLSAGGLVGLYAVLQYSGLEIFERMPAAQGARVWASLGNPVYAGALCGMAVPLAVARWMTPGLSGFRRGRCLVWGVLSGIGLVLSLSRGAWIGVLLALIYLIAVSCRLALWEAFSSRERRWTLAVLVLVAIGGVGGMRSQMRERTKLMFSLHEGSNRARVEGWKSGLRAWQQHPGLGSGPDTFVRAFRPNRTLDYIQATGPGVIQGHAHNDFIQIAATEGILGLGTFIWLLVAIGMLFGRLQRHLEAQGLIAMLGVLFIQNLFNFSSVATCVWTAVGVGALTAEAGVVHDIPLGAIATRLQRIPGIIRLAVISCVCILGFWFGVMRPLMADLAFQGSQRLAERELWKPALGALRYAIRLQPQIEDYTTALANADRQAAQLWPEGPVRKALCDEAWNGAEDSVRRHPTNPDTWNNRGVVAMWVTQLNGTDYREQAQQSFERAITLDPVFVDAWANLAKWEHLAGHLDKEKEIWRHVLLLDSSHLMARQVLGEKG